MKRRDFAMLGLSLAAIGGLAYWQRNSLTRMALTRFSNGSKATLAPKHGASVCVLTPVQTSGPYYVKSPMRSNITEGCPGLPLKLTVEVVKMPGCSPLEGLAVEIWHCDARGYYSGYSKATVRAPFDTLVSVIVNAKDGSIAPTDSETFMRGGQTTDNRGLATFETIFPGWYDPRLTHIHAKVSRDEKTFLTTQLYFPDELVADIYANHPDYIAYGSCPYNLKNDVVLRSLGDATGVVLQTERTNENLTASVRFGIS